MLNFDEHCAAWGLRFESWKMMRMMMMMTMSAASSEVVLDTYAWRS